MFLTLSHKAERYLRPATLDFWFMLATLPPRSTVPQNFAQSSHGTTQELHMTPSRSRKHGERVVKIRKRKQLVKIVLGDGISQII